MLTILTSCSVMTTELLPRSLVVCVLRMWSTPRNFVGVTDGHVTKITHITAHYLRERTMTKELRITTVWKNDHVVEVPDDFEPFDDNLDYEDWMDQVDATGAWLADWYWHD